ncbi:DUF1206 domain-containing protein [Actinoplanes regularis]|uniref:DUF1206 domain-containing protein n=1 Tax=Actinoplanes regularis TaxID=52697 RepID=UPI0025561F82|nr:DUF1206 domain-containing protein [Actinoplanes regularis]GLW34779.1 hypothetical protein Areg01_77160 [Actinoplanes regularis]
MSSSTVKNQASRAADSKLLEYLARGGFVGYGVIHLLFAWIALEVALGGSRQESDQSGALRELVGHSYGRTLLAAIAIGLVAMAIWQLLVAIVGQRGERNRGAIAERVISAVRAVLYVYLAWLAVKVIRGGNASMADNSENRSAGLMQDSGGRFLVALVGVVIVGVGVGIFVYGLKRKFAEHLRVERMPAAGRQPILRLGMAGYMAKGVAYAIAGVLFVAAAVTYDPDKARGLDAALKTLAGYSWGVWLLALIAAGIAAFGVYCLAQAKYRKI